MRRMRKLCASLLLRLMLCASPLLASAEKLETIEVFNETQKVTCSQGLTDCKIEDAKGLLCIRNNGNVSKLSAHTLLCKTRHHWHPCLRINLTITSEDLYESSGPSGESTYEDEIKEEAHHSGLEHSISPASSVQVCYTKPEFSGSRIITFSISDEHAHQMWMSLIVLMKETDFGNKVTVFTSMAEKEITLPTIDTVCSQHPNIKQCTGPILHSVINKSTGMAELRVDSAGKGKSKLVACQKMEPEGHCYVKVKWENPLMIPVRSVAPCLCFQIWWEKSNHRRTEICPFVKDTALSSTNISISVVEAQTNDGPANSGSTTLGWNVTAPCKLEAELELCKKTSGSDSLCVQINDTRRQVHSRQHPGWIHNRQWHLEGRFEQVERHPSLCVQVKVKRMEGYFKPFCPFEVSLSEETRVHWSLTLLVCVVLICLAILGAYAVQGALKAGWVFRWLKVDDISRKVGGGQVVLLYPPDADSSMAELVCHLGSSLSSLGFSVSLDLWSRSELNALGPVPWLHSRLDQVQRHGGKVVLVLNKAAWARAEEWGRRGASGDREECKEATGEGLWEDSGHRSLPCCDVFSASLSCILADYLQGRAGERFALAQFDTQPAGPPVGSGVLPELFRGLPFFSLPSQSLGFLTEIAHVARKEQSNRGEGMMKRSVRAGVLRAASRTLAGTLRELTGSGTGYKLAGFSPGFKLEDQWESIPLQPGQTSPPTSPELQGRSNIINWV